jgi:hypothetical protein
MRQRLAFRLGQKWLSDHPDDKEQADYCRRIGKTADRDNQSAGDQRAIAAR